jgi:hypothetical protein
MAKQQQTTILSGARAARAIDPLAKSTASASKHEQIARLAYSYWQNRGCSEGSPEQDWQRAEAELGKEVTETAR